MQIVQPADRYTRTAMILHWLIAAGVFAQFALGWWMKGIPNDPPGVQAYWYNVHKSIGLTIGMLVIARILWRLRHSPPALPGSMPAWQRKLAFANHIGLYACMVVMPVAGYLGSSFTRYPIRYWGMVLPKWGWDAPALKEICSTVHLIAAVTFMMLVAIHLLAVLKHALIDRDAIWRRMFPFNS